MLNWGQLSYKFAEPGPTMVIDFSIKINETSLFSSHKPFFGLFFFFFFEEKVENIQLIVGSSLLFR